MKTPTRPVLRWHGGKWRLAPWIIDHFPPHRRYTEAFGGAASVLIRKPRAAAEVYNDLDGNVVNLFRVLQDPELSKRLVELIELTPFAREEFELSYVDTSDAVERARRLIMVCFMGFGSNGHNTSVRTGFRASTASETTSPSRDWANYPECLRKVIERFRGVVIESRPALEVIRQHDGPDALHYVDPPYVHSTRGQGSTSGALEKDYRHEMTDADHENLANVLSCARGGVVLSGYPCELYERLYRGWHRIEKMALADGARKRVEVLWINDSAWRGSNAQDKLL